MQCQATRSSGNRNFLWFVMDLECDRRLGRSLLPVHKGIDWVLKHGTEMLGITAISIFGFLVCELNRE